MRARWMLSLGLSLVAGAMFEGAQPQQATAQTGYTCGMRCGAYGCEYAQLDMACYSQSPISCYTSTCPI